MRSAVYRDRVLPSPQRISVPPRISPVPVVLLAAAVVVLTGGGGCVQRTISITSEPRGALVYLNDEEVGRTPISVPFTFYGTYDVRLVHEGYQPLWTAKKARAPWWETPGPDLIAEMIPGARSDQHWHFQMALAPALDEQELIDRARELQNTVQESTQPAG